jgi:acetate kinase
MSKTISINAGSSTLKFQLFEMPSEEVIAKGVIERIGLKDSLVDIKYGDGQRLQETIQASNHEIAINYLLDQLLKLILSRTSMKLLVLVIGSLQGENSSRILF